MRIAALFLALPLAAQVPQSFHGTSNSWSPLAQDKRLHVAAGALVGAPAYVVAQKLGYKHPELHAIFWATLAGYLKEKYDAKHGGRPEYADMAATSLGGALVCIPIRLSQKPKKEFATAPPKPE